jgi:hypothetical protein
LSEIKCTWKIDWDTIFEKVSPDIVQVNDVYKSKIKSGLFNYIKDFLTIESFKKDKINYKISELNELEKRGLDDLFDHNCKSKYFYTFLANYSEPESSYYYYKIYQMALKHKEKNRGSVDSSDYLLEYNLLLNYIKKEVPRIFSKIPDEDFEVLNSVKLSYEYTEAITRLGL